jgi:hypothetical protein
MTDQPIVLAVATYPARADADHAFDSVWHAGQEGKLDHFAAAVLEKGNNGELEIRRHTGADQLSFSGALLGGAITVIAAPLGIAFLAQLVPTAAAWTGVIAIVRHFWHYIPRNTLHRMSDLVESAQAGLVVVAVNRTDDEVAALLLSHPTDKIITDYTWADFAADTHR